MHFILIRTLNKLHKTDSNVFTSLLDWGTIEHHSMFGSMKSKDTRKEKDLWVVLSLTFLLWRHFWCKWLLIQERNMSEKGYDRIPWFLSFLRIPIASFCIRNKFSLEQKVWPLAAVRTSTYSVLGVTPNLLLFCVFFGFTRILCPEDPGNTACKQGLKEQWMVCCA